MVESINLNQTAERKAKLVWSSHDEIHKLAVEPVKALINLVGSKDTTHSTLREIIQLGIRDIITKQGTVPASYAPPLVRIQSCDLPSPCPRPIKRQKPEGMQNETGFLKKNFFTSLAYNKPAVTIFVFDWRDWAKYVPAGEIFDWKEHEQLVLEQIKAHSDSWLRGLSVPSKYMIVILFPQASPGTQATYNIDQCMQSFRKAVQLSGDENIKSSNYFLSNGFEALKTGMQKKFVKNVHELLVSYYREKKNNIKRKQKKLIVSQPPHIRYGMHMALYSLITANDFTKSIEKLDASYQLLKQTQIGQVNKNNDEKRENADILAMSILTLYLQSNELKKFIEFYRSHFRYFQKEMMTLRAELRCEEMKWRSCWFHMIGTLMQRYYNQQGGLHMIERMWHTQQSLDYFPGHYYLNCMLQLIGRQQELGKLKLDCLATGRQLYDLAVIESVQKSQSSYLGKEYQVQDRDRADRMHRTGDYFDDCLTQYRIYEESQAQLGKEIFDAGQIAIGYYKQRSTLMRGPTGTIYTRTVHFINYHLGELLDRQSKEDDFGDLVGAPPQGESKPHVSIQDKQKFRRQMQSQLVKEKWTKEAIILLEKSKDNSAGLEEYFQNQMKILMNAHSLQNHKRHSRLMDLVEKVQSQRCEDQTQIKLTGIMQGTSLIWARARFEHSRIQINKFNKLTLEVFSRLSQPIKIAKLNIMMSQVDLSQEIDFSEDDSQQDHFFHLSKTNPIKLERQFYLNHEDDQIGQIMLNQILLVVAPKKSASSIIDSQKDQATQVQNLLCFSISPYLAPQENLLDLDSQSTNGKKKVKVLKRLPPPIMYSIDPMPHKIKIESIQSDAKDQALLGDPYDLKLKLSILEDIKLKSLKATFMQMGSSSQVEGMQEVIQSDANESVMTIDGLVDVNLSQASIPTGLSGTGNISASSTVFNPNMSQFYQNARSILSTSSVMPQSVSSLFMGADPSIGVAVLKRSMTITEEGKLKNTSKADQNQQIPSMGQIQEFDQESEMLQPVELFYSKGQSNNVDDFAAINMDKAYESDERVVDLLNEKGEIDELSLKMIFYQQQHLNNLAVEFQYEFTQNQGLEDEAIHTKAFNYNVKIRAHSPFDVEWQIKSSDCWLSSLQHFYSLHLGTNEQLRKFMNLDQRQPSLLDKTVDHLAINEEVNALTGSMVAPEEQSSWLVCKLTSKAEYRDVTLRGLKLQINPEIADFVDIVDSVGCDTDYEDGEMLCIEPGESYEILFKIRVNKVNLAKSFIQDDEIGVQNFGRSNDPVSRDAEAQVADQVKLLKRLYTLQQVELFAELHFEWSSFEAKEDNLIDFGEESARKLNQIIPCCVGSPPINFVTRPLQIRIRNQREIQRVKILQPFTVEYEITNLTSKVISAIIEMHQYHDGPVKAPFLIAGEIKSRIQFMPTEEGYILRYTFYPQVLGISSLPVLSISDVHMHSLHLIKDYTVKVQVTSC